MKLLIKNPLNKEEIEVDARAVRKPKFSNTRGRTWDSFPIWVQIWGFWERTEVYIDTTYGNNGYVEANGRWYAIPILKLTAIGII